MLLIFIDRHQCGWRQLLSKFDEDADRIGCGQPFISTNSSKRLQVPTSSGNDHGKLSLRYRQSIKPRTLESTRGYKLGGLHVIALTPRVPAEHGLMLTSRSPVLHVYFGTGFQLGCKHLAPVLS